MSKLDPMFEPEATSVRRRLALVDCSEAEIATITGHKLGDVRSILDGTIFSRDPALGEAAIHMLEMGYAKQIDEAKTGTDFSK